MERILITGALGQLGVEMLPEIVKIYGESNVICSDIRLPKGDWPCNFVYLDVMDKGAVRRAIKEHRINQIYHLAATLSATAEQSPTRSWDLNVGSLLNILELGVENGIRKIFWPSSIGVFGPDAPKLNTPQDAALNPLTVYGMSKVAGEKWCAYYFNRYGLDVRSIRYPGLIGYNSLPGGGTTDYAVEIFYSAVKQETFKCSIEKDTYLPMMYMPDAIRATIHLMEANASRINVRDSYNLQGLSFTPGMIAEEIVRHYPDFKIDYSPDIRQEIAANWPDSIDDSMARADWGWVSTYNVDAVAADMLNHIKYRMEHNISV